jgi:hypothetical protein
MHSNVHVKYLLMQVLMIAIQRQVNQESCPSADYLLFYGERVEYYENVLFSD